MIKSTVKFAPLRSPTDGSRGHVKVNDTVSSTAATVVVYFNKEGWISNKPFNDKAVHE